MAGHESFPSRRKKWRVELNKFLLAYRSTNRTTTGVSPAELFFRKKVDNQATRAQQFDEKQSDVVYLQVRDHNAERKQLAKDYADGRKHTKDRVVNVRDAVLLKKEGKRAVPIV